MTRGIFVLGGHLSRGTNVRGTNVGGTLVRGKNVTTPHTHGVGVRGGAKL